MGSHDDWYDEKWKTILVTCNQCGETYEATACDVHRHNCIPGLIKRIEALEKLVSKAQEVRDEMH